MTTGRRVDLVQQLVQRGHHHRPIVDVARHAEPVLGEQVDW